MLFWGRPRCRTEALRSMHLARRPLLYPGVAFAKWLRTGGILTVLDPPVLYMLLVTPAPCILPGQVPGFAARARVQQLVMTERGGPAC